MQRCIQDSDIPPFLGQQPTSITGVLGWLGVLWMKHHSLPREVCEQLEKENLAIGFGQRHYNLASYVDLFDAELRRLQEKIKNLAPLDQSVPGLRDELDGMEKSKDLLVELKEESRKPKPKDFPSSSRPKHSLSSPRPEASLSSSQSKDSPCSPQSKDSPSSPRSPTSSPPSKPLPGFRPHSAGGSSLDRLERSSSAT